ncbi:hypothetical protein PoB_000383000 [Plakobranchus ocellatus]|uniref:Uncharacterized protein n=1 Tax=Plakobranchus ocellatus TaxID=259542 RepID=A0AAV3Y3B1_9GAST|nr:hypothetical protein PoB_000383000 [Plakobranchus ocellatus]
MIVDVGGDGTGGGDRTLNGRILADTRADSLSTVPRTLHIVCDGPCWARELAPGWYSKLRQKDIWRNNNDDNDDGGRGCNDDNDDDDDDIDDSDEDDDGGGGDGCGGDDNDDIDNVDDDDGGDGDLESGVIFFSHHYLALKL